MQISSCSVCPLKEFDLSEFIESLSEEERRELKSHRDKLLCTWELYSYCKHNNISIFCPRISSECNMTCGC